VSIWVGDVTSKGGAIITDYGLEGTAVYSIVQGVRASLSKKRTTEIIIDFKPSNTLEQLTKKTKEKSIKTKDYAKVFNLKSVELALIKSYTDKETYLNVKTFIQSLKNLVIPITSLRPIDEAISTVGGIDVDELNPDFSLKKYPNIFTIGEMVDWDAPTGGFLLQGCFSMGYFVGKSILSK
jgi:predicted flavoprotein YhiN